MMIEVADKKGNVGNATNCGQPMQTMELANCLPPLTYTFSLYFGHNSYGWTET
jgi:hypothetical protein